MAEIAWYRKYRPSTMADYMGDNIKNVVKARFTVPENRPQVLMISGNRGCGKTTFARIVSKYYLCENPIEGEPCGECEMCQTINEVLIGGQVDVEVPGVVEVDATTANGKEAIQNIIEDAIIPPMYTKRKVLILDECHMITPSAQNSLLKIIEDIPEHLVVIFATTNIEKVLGTILSRCQLKLEVKKKSVDELADRLLEISKQEGLKVELSALKIIAKKGDRVPREAINLLEDVAKNYGGVISVKTVRESTGDVASELYMEYFKAANTSLEKILEFNKKIKEMDIAPKVFIRGLTRFLLDCLYIRHGIHIEDYPTEYLKEVNDLFKLYTTSEFDTLLQVIEYASKMVGEDEIKGELIITTTALRIGKIGILANGLAEEVEQAEKENKQSIKEYRNNAEIEIANQINNAQVLTPTKEKLIDLLGGMRDVANTANLTIDRTIERKDTRSEDGQFSPEALEDLWNNI